VAWALRARFGLQQHHSIWGWVVGIGFRGRSAFDKVDSFAPRRS